MTIRVDQVTTQEKEAIQHLQQQYILFDPKDAGRIDNFLRTINYERAGWGCRQDSLY